MLYMKKKERINTSYINIPDIITQNATNMEFSYRAHIGFIKAYQYRFHNILPRFFFV